MQRGRRLAFDFGDARIGVAVSDPDSILCSPVKTLNTRSELLWDEIFSLLREFEPIEIYVGRPIHLRGQESPSTAKAEMFARELRERYDLKVSMIDERLSTVSAQRHLHEAGLTSKESRKTIDQAAAVEILNMALDLERKQKRDE